MILLGRQCARVKPQLPTQAGDTVQAGRRERGIPNSWRRSGVCRSTNPGLANQAAGVDDRGGVPHRDVAPTAVIRPSVTAMSARRASAPVQRDDLGRP